MKYSINLLGEKKIPLSDRVMYFFLNYLRYIIVVTQLVVIGVFFYRFQIDQQIVDLKESVEQKKEIIQVVIPLLKEADQIDKKMTESKRIIANQNKFFSMIQYFLSQFPASINLVNLEVSADSIKATGNTVNSYDLQSFYYLLKKDNKFKIIDLQNIKKTEFGFSFTLNLSNFKDV